MSFIEPIAVATAVNTARAGGVDNLVSSLNPLDNFANMSGKLGYYANAWVTLSIAGALFIVGLALIFSKQLAGLIGTGASLAGPGKVAKVASVVGAVKK